MEVGSLMKGDWTVVDDSWLKGDWPVVGDWLAVGDAPLAGDSLIGDLVTAQSLVVVGLVVGD